MKKEFMHPEIDINKFQFCEFISTSIPSMPGDNATDDGTVPDPFAG